MSRFATAAAAATTAKHTAGQVENLAGGKGYAQSSRLELISLLLTSFLQDAHYRSTTDTTKRLKELVKANDPVFAAKAAIYARDTFGMRSVSHVVAVELLDKANWQKLKGTGILRNFFDKVVIRPDDVTEIVALYLATYKDAPIPNSMKRGLGAALSRFDETRLAKYKGEGHAFKLVDAVNLLHPRKTAALTKLMTGKLKPAETWETKLSKAGQSEDGDVEELKAAVWHDLLKAEKLGYLAALRNLRNIAEQGDEKTIKLLVKLIADEEMLRKSRIFPFQLLKAFEVIEGASITNQVKSTMLGALSDAMDNSAANLPKFKGSTAVLLDVSGSMAGVAKIGSIFTAVLARGWGADVMTWSTSANWRAVNPRNPVITIAQGLTFDGGGTDLSCAFRKLAADAPGKYERVVVLSDMQTWVDHGGQKAAWEAYRRTCKVKPHLYTFDLQNYGTMAIPEDKVYCLAGWSDKVWDIMGKLEQDREALVHAVDAVELTGVSEE